MGHDDQENWRSKLTSELAEFAASEAEAERVSILVELNIPPSRVTFGSERVWQGGPPKPLFVEDDRPDQTATLVATITKDLEDLLAEPAHWIGAAKAFVATVSPSELRRVARLSSVQRVRLNRRLR